MATSILDHAALQGLGSVSTRQLQVHRQILLTNADSSIADHGNAKASIACAAHGSDTDHAVVLEMHQDPNSVVQAKVLGDLEVTGSLKYASVEATGGSAFAGGISVTGGNAVVTNQVSAGSLAVTGASTHDHIACTSLTATGGDIIASGVGKKVQAHNGISTFISTDTNDIQSGRDVEAARNVVLTGGSSTYLQANDAHALFNNGYVQVGTTVGNRVKLTASDGKVECKDLAASAGVTAAGALQVTGTARVDGHTTLGVDGEETGNLRVGGLSQFDGMTTHKGGIISEDHIVATGKSVLCGAVSTGSLNVVNNTTMGNSLTVTNSTTTGSLVSNGTIGCATLSCGGTVAAVALQTVGDATIGGALQCSTLNVLGDTTTISSSNVTIADRTLTIGNDETADQTETAARAAATAAGGLDLTFGAFTDAAGAAQKYGGTASYTVAAAGKDSDYFAFDNAVRCEGDLSFGSRLAPAVRMVWRYRTGADKKSPSDKSTVELWMISDEASGFAAPNRLLHQIYDMDEA